MWNCKEIVTRQNVTKQRIMLGIRCKEANAASEMYGHIVVINQSGLAFIGGEMCAPTAAPNDTFLTSICPPALCWLVALWIVGWLFGRYVGHSRLLSPRPDYHLRLAVVHRPTSSIQHHPTCILLHSAHYICHFWPTV